jgi:hypothetical protein
MNERIKLLAIKANLEIDPAHPDHNQKVLEKYFELLVKKCINVTKSIDSQSQWAIEDHFGVEE